MYGDRDVVSDRAVRTVSLVMSTAILQLFTRICKTLEPMPVQAFRPELAVERLDRAFVRGLSRPEEAQGYLVGIGPKVEIPKNIITAFIAPYRLGVSRLRANPF